MRIFQRYTTHFTGEARSCEVAHDGERFLVRAAEDADAPAAEATSAADRPVTSVQWEEQPCGRVLLRLDGRPMECRLTNLPGGALRIEWRGRQAVVQVADDLAERARRAHTHHGGPMPLRSPMPGTVVKLLVAEGDQVQLEQPLCIVEAMKMQNELDAPLAGKIVQLLVKPGQAVEADQVLLEIRPD